MNIYLIYFNFLSQLLINNSQKKTSYISVPLITLIESFHLLFTIIQLCGKRGLRVVCVLPYGA